MVSLTGERYGDLAQRVPLSQRICRCLRLRAETVERRGQGDVRSPRRARDADAKPSGSSPPAPARWPSSWPHPRRKIAQRRARARRDAVRRSAERRAVSRSIRPCCAPRATAPRPATIRRSAASSCSATARPSRHIRRSALHGVRAACHLTPHGKAPSPVRLSRQYLPLAHGRGRVPPRRRGGGRARSASRSTRPARRLACRPGARHTRASRGAQSRHRHLRARARGRSRATTIARFDLLLAMDDSNYDELIELAPKIRAAQDPPLPRFRAAGRHAGRARSLLWRERGLRSCARSDRGKPRAAFSPSCSPTRHEPAKKGA